MLIAYYAHCLAIYNTPQEFRDVHTLTDLGFTVQNPNLPSIQAICDQFKVEGRGKDIMDEVFKPLVMLADVVVFRALPDGSIPAGVAKELEWAREAGKPIMELPTGLKRREMSVELTREYLTEVGQR